MAKLLGYRLILSLTTVVVTPAFAQSAPQASTNPESTSSAPDDSNIADVIVTAQKREQKLQDVGLTVTALGAEELATKRV